MTVPSNQRSTNPAAQQRKTLINALNVQASKLEEATESLSKLASQVEFLLRDRVENHRAIQRMASVVTAHETVNKALSLRNETLERQMHFVSAAAGLTEGVTQIGKAGYSKIAAVFQGSASNPAQPVQEPAPENPGFTEVEMMQPAARTDVTQLGASPLTNVGPAASVAVNEPYGEFANQPVGLNRVDVTAPVDGTQYQRPPSETIIPVDVRVGNPDNPVQAYPWTISDQGPAGSVTPPGPSVGNPPVASENGNQKASSRTYATLRLARLQVQAGIASGDELEIAASLDMSKISDGAIQEQIATLSKVVDAQSRTAGRTVPSIQTRVQASNRLVPKAASLDRAPSLNPSIRNSEAPHPVSLGSVTEDEIAFY